MRLESNCSYVPPAHLVERCAGGVLLWVDTNDKVYAMQELYARNKEGTGDNRYRVLIMPMGNTLSAFWMDMGSAKQFVHEEDGSTYVTPVYTQPILLEHSVAECIHMAEQEEYGFAIKLLNEQVKTSDLIQRYLRQCEEDAYLVKNRSTFGPYQRTERNSYSAAGAREQARKMQESSRGY